MMLPLVVVGCNKAVCQSVREATTASGVDNAASPRLADTAERDYFKHLRERVDHYAKKQLEGTLKYINDMQIEPLISMGNSCNYCEQYVNALPAEYKCLK